MSHWLRLETSTLAVKPPPRKPPEYALNTWYRAAISWWHNEREQTNQEILHMLWKLSIMTSYDHQCSNLRWGKCQNIDEWSVLLRLKAKPWKLWEAVFSRRAVGVEFNTLGRYIRTPLYRHIKFLLDQCGFVRGYMYRNYVGSLAIQFRMSENRQVDLVPVLEFKGA